MTREVVFAALSQTTEAQLMEVEEDRVIWADIPHLECESMTYLIHNYLAVDQRDKAIPLITRLDFLSEKFTDPRTRIVTFDGYHQFFKENTVVLDEKLKTLYDKIKNTPRQVPVIDITEEKRLFLLRLSRYYIAERKDVVTAKLYYGDLLAHFKTLPDHPMYLNGKLGMADNAALLFEQCFTNEDFESSRWYYEQILAVRDAFRGHKFPEINEMISVLGK